MSSRIRTFTGKLVDPLNLQPADICIEDIAHHLSNEARFSGATRWHYSVAQHSIYVSFACEPEHALHGLLHDAEEAYLKDIPSPLKYTEEFRLYRDAANRAQRAIWQKYGLPDTVPSDVKAADIRTYLTESRDIMSVAGTVDGYEPYESEIKRHKPYRIERVFLARFRALYAP